MRVLQDKQLHYFDDSPCREKKSLFTIGRDVELLMNQRTSPKYNFTSRNKKRR